jgi:hypothetical protein
VGNWLVKKFFWGLRALAADAYADVGRKSHKCALASTDSRNYLHERQIQGRFRINGRGVKAQRVFVGYATQGQRRS